MEEDLKTRLRAFISSLNISEREFCGAIGASPAFVQNLGRTIKRPKLEAISAAYPRLNIGWLLSGRGNMIIQPGEDPGLPFGVSTEKTKQAEVAAAPASADVASRLLALVESQQQTIAQLTENNSRLTRLVEEYKKAPAVAPGILAPAGVD